MPNLFVRGVSGHQNGNSHGQLDPLLTVSLNLECLVVQKIMNACSYLHKDFKIETVLYRLQVYFASFFYYVYIYKVIYLVDNPQKSILL